MGKNKSVWGPYIELNIIHCTVGLHLIHIDITVIIY